MRTNRLYKLCYFIVRIFHWCLFFVVLEIAFTVAGWMIFGILGNVTAWAIFTTSGEDYSEECARYFQFAGKALGVLAGIVATWWVMARYREPEPARLSGPMHETPDETLHTK